MIKAIRTLLSAILAVAIISTAAVAGAVFLLDISVLPKEPQQPREVVWDYGVEGSPTATHVYITPRKVGPGRYIYVYSDEDSRVFAYRDDRRN